MRRCQQDTNVANSTSTENVIRWGNDCILDATDGTRSVNPTERSRTGKTHVNTDIVLSVDVRVLGPASPSGIHPDAVASDAELGRLFGLAGIESAPRRSAVKRYVHRSGARSIAATDPFIIRFSHDNP